MGDILNFNNIVHFLEREFPHFTDSINKQRESYKRISEELGQHIIFGDIFTDDLIELAQKDPSGKKMSKMLKFLERMAVSNDNEVINVVELSIIEKLVDQKHIEVLKILHPNSRKIALKIATRWDLEPRSLNI